jgi:hypothetical protein
LYTRIPEAHRNRISIGKKEARGGSPTTDRTGQRRNVALPHSLVRKQLLFESMQLIAYADEGIPMIEFGLTVGAEDRFGVSTVPQ